MLNNIGPRKGPCSTLPKISEAALQRYSLEKVFWKHAANLQENNYAKVWSANAYTSKIFEMFGNKLTDP